MVRTPGSGPGNPGSNPGSLIERYKCMADFLYCMKELQRINQIIKILKKDYPNARCTLDYTTPLELLIATILAAQCTDARVNIVTKTLFKKYKSVKDYADADLRELEEDIKSTGFYKNKSKAIKFSAQTILKDFDGGVPSKMEDLLKLHGVARKTANVILSNCYGVLEGVIVDTHVTRLSQRLGFTKNKEAKKIEQDLMKIIPRKDWLVFANMLVFHGRAVCTAKKPNCGGCHLNKICPSAFKF